MHANEASEDLPKCYQVREVPGHALMLDVRLMNGDRKAFPYAYLIWATLDRASGLYLRFSSHTIHIQGRALDVLYQGVLQHRLEFVQEEDAGHDLGPEDEPFVSAILIRESGEDANQESEQEE